VAIASLADEDVLSEKAILGSLLLNPRLMMSLGLSPSDFTGHHSAIFDSMLGLWTRDQDFDTILVSKELQRRGKHWPGIYAFVSSLTDGIPRNASIDGHVVRVRETAARRKLAKLCQSTLERCYDAGLTSAELLEDLQRAVGLINFSSACGDNLGLVRGSEISAEIPRWLISPYIPEGQLTLLVGDPGVGKTWIAISIAASVTTGHLLFGADRRGPGTVMYLANEDPPGILRYRFDLHGGDPDRIWFETAEKSISLSDIAAIEDAAKKREVSLIVVDTITTHFGAGADFHKASEVAAVLNPIVAMAQRTGVAVIGLMHLSKATQAQSLYRVQGSIAFAGSARSVMAAAADPSDPSRAMLAHLKSNSGALGPTQGFTLGDSGVTWNGTSGLRASDILSPAATSEDRSELTDAVDCLRESLSLGSREAAEVQDELKAQGISVATLRRAKGVLGVKSSKQSSHGKWIWYLPGQGAQQGAQVSGELNS
jgi:replicative DNA helicase